MYIFSQVCLSVSITSVSIVYLSPSGCGCVQGLDGLAGFSVVGGRDQPQLPNPGAFIVTTVNTGGPADGFLK